jgi:hypothetical protein
MIFHLTHKSLLPYCLILFAPWLCVATHPLCVQASIPSFGRCPRALGRVRIGRYEDAPECKKAFIPKWDERLVRGATQLRPAEIRNKNSLMKRQGEKPASLFSTGQERRPIPEPGNGGNRIGYWGLLPFTAQLGGPFGTAVSGRTLTACLLSVPSCSAYSSSSASFNIGPYYRHNAEVVKARNGPVTYLGNG